MAQKINIIVAFITFLAITIFFLGICSLLRQRENQFICSGHLRNLYSALKISHCKYNVYGKIKDETEKQWVERIVSYIGRTEISNCPSNHSDQLQFYSYKINRNFYENNFLNKNKKNILIFDSNYSLSPFVFPEIIFQEISYRHLNGANVLFEDGAIVCFKNEK